MLGRCFLVVYHRPQQNRALIPRPFLMRMQEFPHDYIVLHTGRGTSHVNLFYDEDRDMMFLYEGWAAFVEKHRLEEGYVIHFEYFKSHDLTARVFDSDLVEIESNRPPMDYLLPFALANPAVVIRDFNERSFTVRYFPERCHIAQFPRVPVRFSNANHLQGVTTLVLHSIGGHVYTIDIWRDEMRLRLGQGWDEFAHAHGFVRREKMTFVLISDVLIPEHLRLPRRAHFGYHHHSPPA